MKALFLTLLISFLFYSPMSFAFLSEDDQDNASPIGSSDLNLSKKFNIKTNVGTAIFGIYSLGLDYKITPHTSITGTLLIGSFEEKAKDDSFNFEIETKGANIMLNYHLNEVYTNSLYASVFAGFLVIDVELKNFSIPTSASIDTPYIGAEFGYIHYFNRLNLTIGAGGSKTAKDEETEIKIGNFSGTAKVQVHLNFHINASIGYVF